MTKRDILWTPSPERANASTMAAFQSCVEARTGQCFQNYQEMWNWSVSDLEAFWSEIAAFFQLGFYEKPKAVLADAEMPGAKWFPGAKVNFAGQILSHVESFGDHSAFVLQSETFGRLELTWKELQDRVASVAHELTELGVQKGDRVVAILPNTDTALIALLASASIGAIWSLCSPDMGEVAIIDRFRQIEPKVLIAQNGYIFGGKTIDKREALSKIRRELNTLEHYISVSVLENCDSGAIEWAPLTQGAHRFKPLPVDFEDPLWVVYSSGTTGNPKPIVHGHGGVLIEGMKQSLHHDLSAQDRFCWLTSSGWIMWNAQWMALGRGACVCAFDGALNLPSMLRVWQFVSDERLTYFGAGAAFYEACMKASISPKEEVDLSPLRSLGSTGSPLSGDAYDWIYETVKRDVWLAPISGGTDLCGAFVLGHPQMPVRKGEMQCRALGNAVRAFDEAGDEIFNQVGELVCTAPLPSMPLYFWGDTDNKRLKESYFDTYPGIWCHGDWIEFNDDGGSVIYGRSDATINRRGLRLGSAEIYQAVERLSNVMDSLVIDLEYLGRESFMPLFVVLREGVSLSEALCSNIHSAIKADVSPRFLPDEIIEIEAVPRTLSGKKLEVPIKKLLLGGAADKVVNRDSMANPESFDFFIAYSKKYVNRMNNERSQ